MERKLAFWVEATFRLPKRVKNKTNIELLTLFYCLHACAFKTTHEQGHQTYANKQYCFPRTEHQGVMALFFAKLIAYSLFFKGVHSQTMSNTATIVVQTRH